MWLDVTATHHFHCSQHNLSQTCTYKLSAVLLCLDFLGFFYSSNTLWHLSFWGFSWASSLKLLKLTIFSKTSGGRLSNHAAPPRHPKPREWHYVESLLVELYWCSLAFAAEPKKKERESQSVVCSRTRACFAIPVAVGHNQAVRLAAGLLALPALHPLLACPAPPLTGRLLFIIIIPCHPAGRRKKKERVRRQRHALSIFNFQPLVSFLLYPQFSLAVRNFKVSGSLNWTVIFAVTKSGGFTPSPPHPPLLFYQVELSAV